MPKSTRNSGRSWTPAQVRQLRSLARGNTPTRVIGLKSGYRPQAGPHGECGPDQGGRAAHQPEADESVAIPPKGSVMDHPEWSRGGFDLGVDEMDRAW
jgi:hypothetical protein